LINNSTLLLLVLLSVVVVVVVVVGTPIALSNRSCGRIANDDNDEKIRFIHVVNSSHGRIKN
jgi:hypothetical protein